MAELREQLQLEAELRAAENEHLGNQLADARLHADAVEGIIEQDRRQHALVEAAQRLLVIVELLTQ